MQDSQSMYCPQCVRKHLANAISYAKEILAGHGAGGDPDHRPDLLGELGNAEHHLQTNPEEALLLEQALGIRRRFEDGNYIPYPSMITELRRLWAETTYDLPELNIPARLVQRPSAQGPHAPVPVRATNNGRYVLPAGLVSRAPVDVLILPGNSAEELAGIRRMIDNLTGVNEVFEEGLPDTTTATTEYLLVWPAHTGIIRSMDAGLDYPMYSNQKDGTVGWDSKPQIVTASAWRETPDLNTLLAGNPLKWNSSIAPFADLTTKADKICCGTKRKFVTGAFFVKWSPVNWGLLSGSLNEKMEWKG